MKKIFLIIFTLCFLICSCSYNNNEEIATKLAIEDPQIYPYTFIFENKLELSPLEPEEGILIGTYFPYNLNYGINDYEKHFPKNMNHYVYEYVLGTEFDTTFLLDCIANNKIPFIKAIPKNYDNYNIDQIASLSNIIKTFNINCYIELLPCPSEKYYNPEDYKQYFEKSSELLRNANQNISIIFTPNQDELFIANDFYPSEQSYDFLGFNYIGSILDDEDFLYENFFNKFNYIYKNKHTDKPIFITTFALSHFSKSNSTYYIDESINYFNNIITIIKSDYKRVKGINFYDVNSTITEFLGEYNNIDNYRITENEKIKNNFYEVIKNDIFLEKYEEPTDYQIKSYSYDAVLVENDYYVSTEIADNKHFEQMKHNPISSSYTFDNKDYYKLDDLFNNEQKHTVKVDTINKKIIVY